MRAGAHSQRLHDRLFVDLKLPYLQVDELHTPVAGNRRHSWLWVAIEPVSKIIPAIHLGTQVNFATMRMILGKRWQLAQILLAQGLSSLIQTAFIERVNLTIRQGVAPLSRKTWSMAKSSQHLLLHVEWWRSYYHLIRAHESLRLRVPGLKRRYRQRSPAMAAGLTDRLWRVGDILRLPLLPEGGAC